MTQKKDGDNMIIVAGIARSGLTATMQMLNAGGYPCLGKYPAFEPFTLGNIQWNICHDHAVKSVDTQLQFPPPGKKYNVLLLSRDFKQQAKSTNKFLGVVASLPPVKVSSLVRVLKRDYLLVYKWARKQRTMILRFEDIISKPIKTAEDINIFVGGKLNVEKMADVIIDRSPDCHPELLELSMIHDE